MATSNRFPIIPALKAAFAAGLISWLVRQDFLSLSALTALLKFEIVAPCLVLLALNMGLSHWRWALLLQARGFSRGFWELLPFTFIGLFFNFVVPGGIGGDLVKGFYLVQDHPDRRTDAATTILMDRVVGLYAMLALGIAPLLWNWDLVLSSPMLVSTTLGLIAGFLGASLVLALALSSRVLNSEKLRGLLFRVPGGDFITRFHKAVHAYRNDWKTLAYSVVLSVLAQLAAIGFMWVVGERIAPSVGLAAYVFAVPVGFIVSALPIAPAGIGVGQMAFFFLFNLYTGHSSELGPSVITAFQVFQFGLGLIGAYFYLRRKRPVRTV